MSDILFPFFPKARFDAMLEAARSHDPSKLPDLNTLKWRWDQTGRMDASESVYLARQLEFLRAGVLEVQYPALKGAKLVPVDTAIDPGAASYTYQTSDHVGQALVTSDLATVPPRADTKGGESTQQIRSVIMAYGYSIQEARAAMFAKIPLIPRRAMACRDIIERTLDDIIFNGNVPMGLKGLLNQSGAGTYTVATGAAGKTWDVKTPDEIVADLNGIVNKIVSDSKEVFQPDTILLPLSAYTLISAKRMGDADPNTIMSHFLRNSPYVTSIEATHKSETAGSGSTRRMVCYRRDPNCISAIMPQPFEQLAPQPENYELVVPCHARTGGVVLFQPLSIAYGDGI